MNFRIFINGSLIGSIFGHLQMHVSPRYHAQIECFIPSKDISHQELTPEIQNRQGILGLKGIDISIE